ncbi:Tricorn protease domain-containing protein, partial [Vibrio splendidus]
YPEFLWAEDSSYLYYVDKFRDWKYTLATGVKRQVETEFNEYSVIYQGKRVIASDLGVGVYDESQDEWLYSVVPDETSEVAVARFRNKSISPTGRYVWAETRTRRYLIDVKSKSFQSEEIVPRAMGKFRYFEVLGKDANYIHEGAARVVVSKLTEEKHFGPYLKWKQTNSADLSSLYNGFANDGDFVKGHEL